MRFQEKQVRFSEDARERVRQGAEKLYNVVAPTMGAAGRNILIEREFDLLNTMDGITVARHFDVTDKDEELGIVLVRDAANKTNQQAGDGTTTATVLAYEMMQEGMKHLSTGRNAISMRNGMKAACAEIVEKIKGMSKEVKGKKDYHAVARVASRDDDVAELISELMAKLGKDGVITIEPGQAIGIETVHTDGLQVNRGYLSPYFMNTPRMECVLENPYIIFYEGKISDVYELLPIMKKIEEKSKEQEKKSYSMLIVAENVTGSALTTLVVNHNKNTFGACAIPAPEWGDKRKEVMEDLAIMTNGKVVSPEMAMKIEDMELEMCGSADKVVIGRELTTIVGGAGSKENIEGHVEELRDRASREDEGFEKDKVEERIARLTNGIVLLKVGGATEIEMNEKLHRVEDALGAVKSAAEEGIVPGGGAALLRAKKGYSVDASDEGVGKSIVYGALGSCCRRIAANAGHNGDLVAGKVEEAEDNIGFNVMSGEYEDLIKAGIINPAKVERCALENAVSVASMFLGVEGAITLLPQEESKEPPYPSV